MYRYDLYKNSISHLEKLSVDRQRRKKKAPSKGNDYGIDADASSDEDLPIPAQNAQGW